MRARLSADRGQPVRGAVRGATALTLATPTPTIPASGSPVTNANAYTILVTVTGGTMTANTQVGGVSTGQTDGTFTVQPGQSIEIFYFSAPA